MSRPRSILINGNERAFRTVFDELISPLLHEISFAAFNVENSIPVPKRLGRSSRPEMPFSKQLVLGK